VRNSALVLPSIILSVIYSFKVAYYAVLGRTKLSYIGMFRELVPQSHCSYSFVYDEYWAKYHIKVFCDRNPLILGFFDFMDSVFENISSERRCVYIFQSLFEDGRSGKEFLDEAISLLKRFSELLIFLFILSCILDHLNMLSHSW